MRRKLLLVFTVVVCVATIANATSKFKFNNSDEDDDDDDQYEKVIRLLKELRKGQKESNYENSNSNNRPASPPPQSRPPQNPPQFQYPRPPFPGFGGGNGGGSSGGNGGGGSGGNPGGPSSGEDATQTPILTPGNNRNPGNFGTIGSLLPGGGNSASQIINQLAQQQPPRPPYPLENVPKGVGTILGGVRQFDLGEILRGSFAFTSNNNVRTVANGVIDSIFGGARRL